MDPGNPQLKCEMTAVFQKTAMMVCSLFKAHYWLHYTQEEKKKIVSEDQSGKRKSLIREGLFFMTGITLNWKLCLCKISPVHAIQQKFQVKFQLAICVSYLFPSFQLPNWRYRIKCEGTPLCNFLLIIQREFPRSCLSIKTKRKFYK